MSEVKVNSIKGVGASVAAISIDNANGSCAANITSINGGQISGRKNLVINGEMKISQRQGTNSTAVTNEHEYVLDRFMVSTVSGGGTSLNVQQLHGNPTGAPYGFAASMKMTVAVADDGGADSFNVVQTRIENLDTNYLAFGTSQAKTVTLSFYVKSSLTGTFGGSLVSADFSKGYVFQYTINSANTWEKKTITIPGDTASTADSVYNRGSATSLRGLVLYFDLGSGSNSEKSAANDWSATGVWGYGARISGNVKLCANAGADWGITGIQLEEGSVATDFEHRSYETELKNCQRYYYVYAHGAEGSNAWQLTNIHGYSTAQLETTIDYTCANLRAIPDLVQGIGTSYYNAVNAGASITFNYFTAIYQPSKRKGLLYANNTLSGTTPASGVAYRCQLGNTNAYIALDAEL